MDINIFAILGFILAAYAIVANDSIQTLGTFLASNAKRPWWQLWAFASSILVAVIVIGWFVNSGDVAYGRLEKFPNPPGGITWIYVIPPLVLLFLTRFGIPVSTTFLILTVFVPANLGPMLTKSLLGYLAAFGIGMAVFVVISKWVEKRFIDTNTQKTQTYWVVLQWGSTAFLWSQWLMQDLANIFVYLPRDLDTILLIFAVVLMVCLQGVIFYRHGGAIQRIVTSKTNTHDIRSATIIDFFYGLILWYFKGVNSWPMSTTWVFLGLLAGRELALTLRLQVRSRSGTGSIIGLDALKAVSGLGVSVLLALGLPALAQAVAPEEEPPVRAEATEQAKERELLPVATIQAEGLGHPRP